MNTSINVGDFFYDIYGYDATLVDFYQVVRVVSEKTIELRKVARNYLSPESVTPKKDEFKSEPFLIRKNKYGRFKFSEWNGAPKYISAFGSY